MGAVMGASRLIAAALLTALLTGLLAACATPETRVRNSLVNAGLSRPVADCMAGRMVDNLSLGQLQKLGSLGKLHDRDPGDISFNEFARRTRGLRDPEILGVVTASGAICALRSR